MILVIGSQGAGKRDYVRSLGYTEEQLANGVLDESPVVLDVQELVRQRPKDTEALLAELSTKKVAVCCEVGCGVIPAERAERDWREATGRLCVLLAQRATKVVRLVAGIPQVIKG